jgi:hypothetical protein
MKKKIFGGIAMLAVAAVAVFNVNFSAKSNGLSAIGLANVEALASESSGSSKSCYNHIAAKENATERKCGSCEMVDGRADGWKGVCG